MTRAASFALLALTLLAASPAAGQQPATEPLPDGWVLHPKAGPFSSAVAVACSRDRAFGRSWFGDVGAFDGKQWHRLPPIPGNRKGRTYGRTLAVSADGKALFVEASGRVARWNGRSWSMLTLPGWRGPISAMTVLPSGELLVVGDGRIGLRAGDVIKSHNSGTWRSLRAVGGTGLGDLYTAGQGGTIMRRQGQRWSRMKTGATAFLAGLRVLGGGRVWAWNGGRRWTPKPVVLRLEGGSWRRADTGLKSTITGLAGDGDRPWATGEKFVARHDGKAWVTMLTTSQLGAGYHRFVGICATSRFLYVADGAHSLVRPRK